MLFVAGSDGPASVWHVSEGGRWGHDDVPGWCQSWKTPRLCYKGNVSQWFENCALTFVCYVKILVSAIQKYKQNKVHEFHHIYLSVCVIIENVAKL